MYSSAGQFLHLEHSRTRSYVLVNVHLQPPNVHPDDMILMCSQRLEAATESGGPGVARGRMLPTASLLTIPA